MIVPANLYRMVRTATHHPFGHPPPSPSGAYPVSPNRPHVACAITLTWEKIRLHAIFVCFRPYPRPGVITLQTGTAS